jgi:hypothetical protein
MKSLFLLPSIIKYIFMKFLNLCLLIFSINLFFVSCKKTESSTDIKINNYEKAINYLKQRRSTVSIYHSNKIDTLINNLSSENINIITVGGIRLIVCDLKKYKNISKVGFGNTYYKMSFPMSYDEITSGLIYTIHTNFLKDKIDKDFKNILEQNSKEFTGEIVTNSINDRFIQAFDMKQGRLEKAYELGTKPPQNNIQNPQNNSISNCSAFYLVTTYYYPDGHVETEWDYLYTICSPCNTAGQPTSYLFPDCDPQVGGGGAVPIIHETEEVTEEVSESDNTYSGGPYPAIKYNYHATIYRVNREVTHVAVFPTTVNNGVSWYVDNYGRNTTRTITLFGHSNSWTALGTNAIVNWSCFVHAKYDYANNVSPTFTRQWTNNKTKTF